MAPPDPEHVRQLTREILSRPEFNSNSYQAQLLQYLADLISWVFDLISSLLRMLGLSGSPQVSLVLLVGLLTAVAVLIVYLVYHAVAARRARRPNPVATSTATSRALEDVADDWQSAARLAREAIAAGDAYRAIWIAHRLLLDALDRSGVIRFSKWKTNTDYLRESVAHPPQHGMLDEVTEVYDRVVYAHRDADLQAIAAILDRVEDEHARA